MANGGFGSAQTPRAGAQFGARRLVTTTDRRRAKRKPVGVEVSLYSVSQSRVVLLLDVSPTGAQFGGQDLPPAGRDVLLKVARVELFGTVVRSCDGKAAIAFERPIGSRDLEELQAAVGEQTEMATVQAG